MRLAWLAVVIAVAAGVVACAEAGPSEAEVSQIVDSRVATAIAAIPTVTPAPIAPTATPVTFPNTPTPAPTATPQPTPTRQPTPTQIRFPATSTPPPPTKSFSQVFNRSAPSIFRIETLQGMGTGWLIEPGLILTNHHVVEGAATVTVRQAENSLFSANVVAVDQIRDIALLRFNVDQVTLDPQAIPLPLGAVQNPQSLASNLMAMGYSGGLTPRDDGTIGPATANLGILSSIVQFIVADVINLVIDAPIDPGDSGGPVLNLDGEVVGMTRAAQTSTGSGQRVVGTFYAVHIDEIRNALPSLKSGISR